MPLGEPFVAPAGPGACLICGEEAGAFVTRGKLGPAWYCGRHRDHVVLGVRNEPMPRMQRDDSPAAWGGPMPWPTKEDGDGDS